MFMVYGTIAVALFLASIIGATMLTAMIARDLNS